MKNWKVAIAAVFTSFVLFFAPVARASEPVGTTPDTPLIAFPEWFPMAATVIFALAILHTFLVSKFAHIAHQFKEGSVGENFFHLLGEVEAVFIIWSGILIALLAVSVDWISSVHYLEGLNYTEPLFVFVIMTIAATKPLIDLADKAIRFVDRFLPLRGAAGFLASVLIFGPLLGSFITEPAAMTLTALILYRQFFSRGISTKLKYLILGVLFVNVSIGGALTNFAAPPIIVVAAKWGLTLPYMFTNFGWRAALAVIINAYSVAYLYRKELNKTMTVLKDSGARGDEAAEMKRTPLWVSLFHIFFLAMVVLNAHYSTVFMAVFIFFLGFATVTQEYQDKLKLREALLVGGFLAGLVTLGTLQKWWIQPVITSLPDLPLFFGTVMLTSFTDNAALTYLASQVENLSHTKQYLVLAGALAGGGLTVIANAPNPAGYSILNPAFGKDGVSPIKLFTAALLPTVVAILCFLAFAPGK